MGSNFKRPLGIDSCTIFDMGGTGRIAGRIDRSQCRRQSIAQGQCRGIGNGMGFRCQSYIPRCCYISCAINVNCRISIRIH